jgi:hypothetical protein
VDLPGQDMLVNISLAGERSSAHLNQVKTFRQALPNTRVKFPIALGVDFFFLMELRTANGLRQ